MGSEQRKATLRTAGRKKAGTWQFYRGSDGEWRWKRVDGDGGIIGLSVRSYRHLIECLADARAEGCTADSQSRFMNWPG
jgi:hypothetical protein